MRLNRRTILFISLFVALLGSAVFAYAVLAQPDLGLQYGAATGLPATDIRLIAARIIRAALGLLGIVALCLILYGGFVWMTAGGNEENIAKAKKILVNAAIGLVIILSAYAIASFVINALLQATTGGEGGAGVPGGPSGGFSKVLYITSMPGNDLGCGARNVHPLITFNRPVDLDTINGNLVIRVKTTSSSASGVWHFVSPNRQNAIVFDPVGDCGGGSSRSDCLEASTTYQIFFVDASAIKSQTDNLSLLCGVGGYKKQCTNNPSVEFTTGASVDTQAPTVTITRPFEGQAFGQGSPVEVDINYTDDFGVAQLGFQVNGFDFENLQISGCKKSGTTTINWPSGSSPTGTYALTAVAADGAANMASDTRNIILRPASCFNDVLDPGEEQIGPPACGQNSGCGLCAGGQCSNNKDCASGYCEIVPGQMTGICVDKMMIKEFSPPSGAVSTTYLSIYGQYFGEGGGHVYMTRAGSGWTEAFVVSCGAGIDNWTPSQIIVKVPSDAGSGPLMVETASTTAGGTERKWTDYTNDGWGPHLNDFIVDNSKLTPGICTLRPSTGTPYSDTMLVGENFGMTQNNPSGDKVMFSASSTAVIRSWTDRTVKARVPALATGATGVSIFNEGLKSNIVRFYVYDLLDSSAPLIESISPDHGAKGEYVTITGKNFGNLQGLVLFKYPGETMAHNGSFNFPAACEGVLWSDKQIIVKFPTDATQYGPYTVQIERSSDSVIGPIGASFLLQAGRPGPGICRLDPLSGPVPFATNTWMMIYGEYFNPDNAPYTPGQAISADSPLAVPFYWTADASSASLQGRLMATEISSISDQLIVARPPNGTLTGPVVAYRGSDQKTGNSLPFTAFDCTKSNNTCALPDMQCCTDGADKGICRPNTDLCAGHTRSTGYMWRFNTGPFPPTPFVVERCDAQTDLGNNLPSPSPNIAWTGAGNYDHYNACRTALVNIEFSMLMSSSSINSENIKVYECTTSSVSSTLSNSINTCDHIGGAITMTPDSYKEFISEGDENGTRSYVQMIPQEGRRWKDNTWYQVVLTDSVQSAPTTYLFGTTTRYLGAQNLEKSRSCGMDGNKNTSYCFIFRTDERDCKLKTVVVTPYSYWTAVLEAPIKYRSIKDNSIDVGSQLYWRGNGLSDQHCIMMDISGFDWSWNIQEGRSDYAEIYLTPTGTGHSLAEVTAKANTVAVGLTEPADAVNVEATASTGTVSKTGTSSLTIDLSKPRVLDYWPKCLEACPNAEVGAQFNILMSSHNVGPASVHLYKCLEENCFSAERISDINPYFDLADRRMLKIPFIDTAKMLDPDTIYQVVLSFDSTSTDFQSSQLWAGANSTNPAAYGKPMQQSFTWRFRTKKDQCVINSVNIIPALFTAVFITDRQVYSAETRAAPDACDAKGQRLDPWKFNWDWQSSAPEVATVNEYITKGQNPACTANCLKKGSDVPAGSAQIVPLCGNGLIEAGEDCDPPLAFVVTGSTTVACTLDCLRPGNKKATTTTGQGQNLCGDAYISPNFGEECDPKDEATKAGCSPTCQHAGSSPATGAEQVGASICGNGTVGAGEECDLGVTPLRTAVTSSMNCSANCLHLGSALSAGWCAENTSTFGGFTQQEYVTACKKSLSQCGDGITSPGEDEGCERPDLLAGVDPNCSASCLAINTNLEKCPPISTTKQKINGAWATVTGYTEGCGLDGQYTGSSLLYSTPSVCGDEKVGIGEDPSCENGFVYSHLFVNPWALAIGVGNGAVSGEPPAQVTNITGAGTQKIGTKTYSKSGYGQFKIMCGYSSDTECKKFGPNFGVANNSCCYERANLISTYPAKNDASPPYDICPNTYLEAVFDKRIDQATVPGSLLIARGSSTLTACPYGQRDVTYLIAGAQGTKASPQLPWYKRIFTRLADWFRNFFFGEKAAAAPRTEIESNIFCAGLDIGAPLVVSEGDASSTDVNVTSTIIIKLNSPLATDTDYAIILRPGIKDTQGVSIASTSWKFIAGENICELSNVQIDPAQYLFQHAGSSTNFVASTTAANGQRIQPVDGYRWEYVWAPMQNDYVSLTNTTDTVNEVTAKDRNGEMDLSVTTNVTENKFTSTNPALSGLSHITVFLCENPWPPVGSFPFKDVAFDFKTYYCRDSGGPGFADDLPDITASSTTWTGSSSDPYLEKYLFTNTDNKDAVGIQVFKNTSHLSIRDWLASQGYIGSFGSLKVDGYDAAGDGNNTYVDAIKLPNLQKAGMYTNVYLFSINGDATPETKNVYEQLMSNLTFNLDAPSIYSCASVQKIEGNYHIQFKNDFTCQNDLDCLAQTQAYNNNNPNQPLATYYCLNIKDKLQRNYQRLKDLRYIAGTIHDYNDSWQTMNSSTDKHYPLMKENTFLPGQALSVWTNSWTELGTELGSSMPNDPINKLAQGGTCFKQVNKACYKDTDCATIPMVGDGRISYWPIEGTIKDEGPLKNDGQTEGAVGSADGKGHGKALEFTGQADAKFVIPHNDQYNSDSFTVSAWIYPTKKNTATIIMKGGSDDKSNSLGGFVLGYSGFSYDGGVSHFNNGTVRFAVFPSSTNASKFFAVDSNAPLALNQWHHLAAVVHALPHLPGETGNVGIKLYIDGAPAPGDGLIRNDAMQVQTHANLAFNTLNIEGGQNFNGLIDNISFYNKALDPDKIRGLYQGLCILHDPATGWSAEDRRFSFACVTSSYAYRYTYFDDKKDFVLRANLETDGIFKPAIPVANNLIKSFVSTSVDVNFSSGVCAGTDEISSPYNTVCGDGVLGGTEKCDPPGKTYIDTSNCPGATTTKKTCNSDCTWGPEQTVGCRVAIGGYCGDGKIQTQAGEICDDGALNGQNGRCKAPGMNNNPADPGCNGIVTTCGDGKVQADELCDTAQYKSGQPGWCVGGPYLFSILLPVKTLKGCSANAADQCSTNNCYISDSRYGLNKSDSCNYDCKSRGPYCGDGIVSAEWGEQCETDESCTVDGKAGKKKCTFCRQDNRNVSGLQNLWDFDWTDDANGDVFDSKLARNGTCKFLGSTSECPIPAEGVFPGSRSYEYGKSGVNMIRVDDSAGDLVGQDFTIETWIYPSSTGTEAAQRVMQKGITNSNEKGGFYVFYYGNIKKIYFGVWDNSTPAGSETKIISNPIEPGIWHHIAIVFDGQSLIAPNSYNGTMKLYVDGILQGSFSSTSPIFSTNTYSLCMGARCKPSGAEYVPDDDDVHYPHFRGKIDEFYLYNVALSEKTISDHYKSKGWYCSAITEASTEGACGNSVVDENEACDMGLQNGVACTPVAPHTTCTYCSADCRNVLTYTATSTIACGNGVVDSAYEVCDPSNTSSSLRRSRGAGSDYSDYCWVCKSDCSGYNITQNNAGSKCRAAGLGFCGDSIINGYEDCDTGGVDGWDNNLDPSVLCSPAQYCIRM